MAVTLYINGTAFYSESLEQRTGYTYNPGRIVYNGQGVQVAGGLPSFTLKYNWLNANEWNWWTSTILSGALSKLCNTGNTKLYDDDLALTTYASCVVHRPIAQRYENGLRRDVEIRITALVEST
jgi:hypothetical protein